MNKKMSSIIAIVIMFIILVGFSVWWFNKDNIKLGKFNTMDEPVEYGEIIISDNEENYEEYDLTQTTNEKQEDLSNTEKESEKSDVAGTTLTLTPETKQAFLKEHGKLSKAALDEYNNILIQDNEVLIPFNLVLKVFYYDSYYYKHDGVKRHLEAEFGENTLECDFENKIYTYNNNPLDESYILTVGDRNEGTFIVDGDVYVTIDCIKDIFKFDTQWDENNKTLTITS